MARKLKKTIQPEDLPEIEFEDLYEDGIYLRMNRFRLNNGMYRIVGTKNENGKWFRSMLCEDTRKYTWVSDDLIKRKVMEKKKRRRSRIPTPTKVLEKLLDNGINPTIEEHKKAFPNQKNIFDEIPDVKINKS